MVIEDRGIGLALDKQLEHAADVRPRRAASQFAIAERASASFAKQVVALGIVWPTGIESPHIPNALAHSLAALEHDGPIAALGQKVSGERAGRPGADNNRPLR